MSVAACRRLPSGVRAIAGGRAGAHVSAFLALGSLALTLIVVVGRVLLLLCCNVNRTNSVELLTLHCSTHGPSRYDAICNIMQYSHDTFVICL